MANIFSSSNKYDRGLVRAHLLNSTVGKLLCWEDIFKWKASDGLLWVHLDRTDAYVEQWLINDDAITPEIVNSLLKDDTRPRFSEVADDQVLLIVKGVNLNSDSTPEDMVALRMWTDGSRLITLGFKPIAAVSAAGKLYEQSKGPKSIEGLLLQLIRNLDSKIEPLVYELSNELDTFENSLDAGNELEENQLHMLQVKALILNRHLTPQRDVLNRLRQTNTAWLKKLRGNWRELYYALTVYVDELSELNDRILMLQEAKNQQLLQQTSQTMYMLSLVAAIFLPLSFVTGLLGINVGGIPGEDSSLGFVVVCVLMAILGVAQLMFFKRKKWL